MPTPRDPKTDHLLSPENSALILIDYQPGLIEGTNSIDKDVLVNNAVAMAKTGVMYELPIILSTIAVSSSAASRPEAASSIASRSSGQPSAPSAALQWYG